MKSVKPTGTFVTVTADRLTRKEMENAILQLIRLKRYPVVDERSVASLLHSSETDASATVSQWASGFAAQHGLTWNRRDDMGDLLFVKSGSVIVTA